MESKKKAHTKFMTDSDANVKTEKVRRPQHIRVVGE